MSSRTDAESPAQHDPLLVESLRAARSDSWTDSVAGLLYRRRDWVEPIAWFLVVRLIGILVLERFAQLRGTTLGDALSAWDGKWMLAIAQYGYDNVPFTQTDARGLHDADTAYAFFPGYPMLVGAVARLPGFGPLGAALTVNVVVGSLAAVGVARLGALCARRMSAPDAAGGWFTSNLRLPTRVAVWLDAEDGARRADAGPCDPHRAGLMLVVLFAASPMGVVLSMAYTEALFCALAAWALVGVLRRQWLLAGVCALLCGLTRPTAVVLIAVVMIWALMAALRGSRNGRARAWGAVILSPLGYLAYLAVVWVHTGSPTGWFRIQTEGWGTEIDYGRATFDFINTSLVGESQVAPMATTWILLATFALIVVAAWQRLPAPVLLYGTLVVVSIAASSGLMMSRGRLLLPAFVLLVPLAIGLARMRLSAAVALLAVAVIGSSWFGAHMLTVYPHAI